MATQVRSLRAVRRPTRWHGRATGGEWGRKPVGAAPRFLPARLPGPGLSQHAQKRMHGTGCGREGQWILDRTSWPINDQDVWRLGGMFCTIRVPGERTRNGTVDHLPHWQAMEGDRHWVGNCGSQRLRLPKGTTLDTGRRGFRWGGGVRLGVPPRPRVGIPCNRLLGERAGHYVRQMREGLVRTPSGSVLTRAPGPPA
jgi:hypothetical protein